MGGRYRVGQAISIQMQIGQLGKATKAAVSYGGESGGVIGERGLVSSGYDHAAALPAIGQIQILQAFGTHQIGYVAD